MGATAFTAVAAGAGDTGDTTGPASGDGVVPTLLPGNPTCGDLGYTGELKVQGPDGDQQPPNGTYDALPTAGTVTVLNSDGFFFDWNSTVAIDRVIVKGGNNADSFVYAPADNGDTQLHGPYDVKMDGSTTPRAISHANFCFNAESTPDALPPTVDKDAAGTYDDAYTWNVDKAVVGDSLVSTLASTATFNYTVDVGHGDSAPTNGKVTGTINVTNPNLVDSLVIDSVSDKLSNGTDCTVTGGGSQTIPAASTVSTITYECDVDVSTGVPDELKNTAKVTWLDQTLDSGSKLDAGSDDFETGVIGFNAGDTVDECTNVVDNMDGQLQKDLGKVCVGDANPTTLGPYSRDVNVVPNTCTSYDNTATSTTEDTLAEASDTATVNVCGPVTGGLTIGFWQNKNGQAIINPPKSYGTCAVGTYLRALPYLPGPFQNLSATAKCSEVASYVTTVIKAANASGASMHAMLKAQMLATALDVYFDKVDGSVNVDLTKIPKPVTSANLEDTSGAFNPPPTVEPQGDTCLSVNELLANAASQSSSNGSTWYSTKAIQELAKDTFDAINNEKVVTCV